MTVKAISVLAATVLAIGVVAADDRDKPAANVDATFKSLDRDADQRLSKSEAANDTMLSEHFAAVDGDRDGYVTKREYASHMKSMKSEPTQKDY